MTVVVNPKLGNLNQISHVSRLLPAFQSEVVLLVFCGFELLWQESEMFVAMLFFWRLLLRLRLCLLARSFLLFSSSLELQLHR